MLPIIIFNACEKEELSTLTGTSWINTSTEDGMTTTITLKFNSETSFTLKENIKGIVGGQVINETDIILGSYVYNSKSGDITICDSDGTGCNEGNIKKNNLTLDVEGETVIFTKQ